jgi:hypothetical protein
MCSTSLDKVAERTKTKTKIGETTKIGVYFFLVMKKILIE